MSKEFHGPWQMSDILDDGEYGVIRADGEILIGVPNRLSADELRLIAAAPDLLAALEIARNYIDAVITNSPNPKKRRNYQDALSIIERALCKAQGLQP